MIQYTIGELENILKVKFPESFHKIYDTGAMQWLTRKDDETEISADSFFYNLDWDFNMLKFSEIPETTEYLYKHLDTERLMFRLVPFAETANKDIYCFAYDGDNEPFIVCIDTDNAEDAEFSAEDFGNLVFQRLALAITDLVTDEEDIAKIKAHIKFLPEEYQQMFIEQDIDRIEDAFSECDVLRIIDIYKNK